MYFFKYIIFNKYNYDKIFSGKKYAFKKSEYLRYMYIYKLLQLISREKQDVYLNFLINRY